jgi:septal ring factor EnvC (AmiA/AmiB activator)
MTNAELIEELRGCSNWIEKVAASSQYAHDELMALHYGDKLRDAADALEAAEQRIAELEKSYAWKAYAALEESIEGYKVRIAELESQAAFFDAEKLNYQENIEYRDERIKELEAQNAELVTKCIQLEAQMPKRGEWIGVNPMVDTEQCSLCGWNIPTYEFETNYCPYCGARMEGEQE